MQIINVLGRPFHASDNGLLLDQAGNETQFKVADLHLKMEARHEINLFSEAQDGDYTAHTGEFPVQYVMAEPTSDFDIFLLIREGRMVRFIDTHRSCIMRD